MKKKCDFVRFEKMGFVVRCFMVGVEKKDLGRTVRVNFFFETENMNCCF